MGMLSNISKGPILQISDDIVNNRSLRYDFLCELKETPQNYLSIFLKYARRTPQGGLSSRQIRYLQRYWFPDPDENPTFRDTWWREQQPIAPILCHGLITAIEEASCNGYDLDLDSYWLCSGNVFESIIMRSRNQVTRLISTPPVPVHLPSSLPPGHVDVWIVKRAIQYETVLVDESRKDPWDPNSPGLPTGGARIVRERVTEEQP